MPKFLQSGALFALTLALAPLAARADEVMFRGQKIEYGGASEVKLIGEEGSGYEELLLIWTNTAENANNYFKPSARVDVNLLAVAGGTIKASTYTSKGAGGGGGTTGSTDPGGGKNFVKTRQKARFFRAFCLVKGGVVKSLQEVIKYKNMVGRKRMKIFLLVAMVVFTFQKTAHAPTLAEARLCDQPQQSELRDFCGQKIEYGGASEVKVWGEEGSGMEELVLDFDNADLMVVKYFKSPHRFSAHVLAVDGGGADELTDRNDLRRIGDKMEHEMKFRWKTIVTLVGLTATLLWCASRSKVPLVEFNVRNCPLINLKFDFSKHVTVQCDTAKGVETHQ